MTTEFPYERPAQPGYLWGQNSEEPIIVGPEDKWHWCAMPGIRVPYWELFNGVRPIGLHVFPIHENQDWPDVLFQMLTGLNNGL